MSARTEFVVDLDAFAANLAAIREKVAPAEHMLVVKDDAYAHGLDQIITRAWNEGVRWIGALDVTTGVRVREVLGNEARIFAWMIQSAADVDDAVAADLDCGIGSSQLLDEIAAGAGTSPVRVHLKIDTGLHRNGVRPEQWPEFVAKAREYERAGRIAVVGIWSHISEASDAEDDKSRAIFDDAVAHARAVGLAPTHLHLAASAAAFARPEYRYDMVRIGAFSYGIRSTDGPTDAELGISPIAGLRSEVISADARAVTLDAGWSALSSPMSGHVCIETVEGARLISDAQRDGCTVEPFATQVGEYVAIFGRGATDSATDIAERIGTIGEEIILRISPLVPRVYVP